MWQYFPNIFLYPECLHNFQQQPRQRPPRHRRLPRHLKFRTFATSSNIFHFYGSYQSGKVFVPIFRTSNPSVKATRYSRLVRKFRTTTTFRRVFNRIFLKAISRIFHKFINRMSRRKSPKLRCRRIYLHKSFKILFSMEVWVALRLADRQERPRNLIQFLFTQHQRATQYFIPFTLRQRQKSFKSFR